MTEPVTLTVEDARELASFDAGDGFDEWTVVADERLGESRWVSTNRLVIRRDSDGQHFAATYRCGLSESQEMRPWEDETEAVFTPVIARTRTVEVVEYVDAPTGASPAQVLAVPIDENEVDADTIRDYLVELLAAVWNQQEDFSGKRPFGESGWPTLFRKALVRAGLVDGSFDESGYLKNVDTAKAHELIESAIRALGAPATEGE